MVKVRFRRLFDRLPVRISTSDLHHRIISELMILECSFPLKPLLKHVKAHLNNTSDLIARFDSIESSQLEGMVPVSFDVVSLYTKFDMQEAINSSLEYARGYREWGLFIKSSRAKRWGTPKSARTIECIVHAVK